MSITIHIYYTGKNGAARQFAKEMTDSGIVDAIRSEKGNLNYDYFLPMNDSETVLLIDSWQSQVDLDRHHSSEIMEKIAELREKHDLHMKVERFTQEYNNKSDEAFIRK